MQTQIHLNVCHPWQPRQLDLLIKQGNTSAWCWLDSGDLGKKIFKIISIYVSPRTAAKEIDVYSVSIKKKTTTKKTDFHHSLNNTGCHYNFLAGFGFVKKKKKPWVHLIFTWHGLIIVNNCADLTLIDQMTGKMWN